MHVIRVLHGLIDSAAPLPPPEVAPLEVAARLDEEVFYNVHSFHLPSALA